MNSSTSRLAFCCAGGVLAIACSLPAQAQFGGGGMGGGRRGGSSPNAVAPHDADAPQGVSAADALYQVRMGLLITPEQAPAWEAFYRAYLGWIAIPTDPRSSAQVAGALQSAQRQLTLAQNRFAATEDLAQAAKTLLAGLTPTQQQAADDLLPRLFALSSPAGQRITAR
ncbi:hypothetical protein [Ramlibacter sp.]|uniref:hypothetical protein n=1 Tax=Ramlibacter sp. TaxID=1917967 RepID=UPI00263167FA|nr:hypothetical protein [Ramlibacter sp.]MDB5956494.1 hypothetical protein [Ramlibacter sp.]